jgi:hypothetical protein
LNYKASKALVVVFCSIFIAIGIGGMVSALIRSDLFLAVWGAGFFGIGLVVMLGRLKQISKFESMTYERYKTDHPEHVRANQVTCFVCGNRRINVRGLMNRTFHREHFCTQCGKTLYYSPEQ